MESIAGPTRPGSSCSCPSPARPELSGIQVLPRWDPPDQVPFAVIAAVQPPEVSEISTSSSMSAVGGVTLRCRIAGHFPGQLSVTWLRKLRHEVVAVTLQDSGDCRIHPGTAVPAPDGKSFQQETRLSLTGSTSHGLGAEYICRVGHVCLGTPVERSSDCDYNRWESYRVRAPKAQLQCAYKGPPPCVGGAVCPPQHAGPRPED
ncbi:uncharacterized protein LOC102379740 isoform X3 [Alligator sinensis]|uniref:Uncharacterized protein LOC102379740 isoform X3 n=1 Tax=Alligator sinensis TaxID=38654 RepID=A0A1U7SW92_ALLSI|nr:uncharacterized protein LOC102379740 isoform X3 [Alligator sinensis]